MTTELDLETVDNTTVLGSDDWDAVNQSMTKLRANWYGVGIGLKVEKECLDELDKNLSTEISMSKILIRWLENYAKPTWRMLAEIAGRYRMDVAREIAKNHPVNHTQKPTPHQQPTPASSQPAAGINTSGEMDLARLNSKEPWKRALQELRPRIADQIEVKSSPDRFGDELIARYFITLEVRRDRVNVAGVTEYKKVTMLLDAVSTDINNAANKEERFRDFVGILYRLDLTDIAKQLIDCYRKHAS